MGTLELEGRVAIVTGTGSPRGMGRAIVELLAERGATIVASDVAQASPDPLMEMMQYNYGAGLGLDECVAAAKAKGASAIGVPCDVTEAGEVEALVQAAMDTFHRVDILVNVAGGSWGSNLVADYEPEQWLKTLHINLYGAFLTTKYALPHLEASGKGAIVNIASVAAVRSHQMISAYGAAKAGLVQFTKDVATEYGARGVRSNCVMPGDIMTDMLAMEFRGMAMMLDMDEAQVAEMSTESTPLKRLGAPQDVAEVVAFLASDRASFLTGLAVPVTGGKELSFRSH